MAKFKINEPVETNDPQVTVEVSLNEPLSVGKHVFQLVVVDDAGNESIPVTAEVIVRDTQRPRAVITAPESVAYGQSFKLDGSQSSDVPPGRIVKYTWTMLGQTNETPITPIRPIRPITPITPIIR